METVYANISLKKQSKKEDKVLDFADFYPRAQMEGEGMYEAQYDVEDADVYWAEEPLTLKEKLWMAAKAADVGVTLVLIALAVVATVQVFAL